MTWSFVADANVTSIVFESDDDPNTEYGVAIDNVVVHDAGRYERLPGDLDESGRCDFNDIEVFASVNNWLRLCGWRNCYCNGADINWDGFVDLLDFALLAGDWLECESGISWTLEVLPSRGGTVVPGEGTYSFCHGTEVPIVATPEVGLSFVEWTGTAVDEGKVNPPDANEATVSIEGNYTLEAVFTQ